MIDEKKSSLLGLKTMGKSEKKINSLFFFHGHENINGQDVNMAVYSVTKFSNPLNALKSHNFRSSTLAFRIPLGH